MSLDRPDVKVRFDPEYHRALKRIADAKGVTMGEWIEDLAVTKIREASLISESAADDYAAVADPLSVEGCTQHPSGRRGGIHGIEASPTFGSAAGEGERRGADQQLVHAVIPGSKSSAIVASGWPDTS
jgi:hypothetical protein